jgi:hypothetical protein
MLALDAGSTLRDELNVWREISSLPRDLFDDVVNRHTPAGLPGRLERVVSHRVAQRVNRLRNTRRSEQALRLAYPLDRS